LQVIHKQFRWMLLDKSDHLYFFGQDNLQKLLLSNQSKLISLNMPFQSNKYIQKHQL
jgi:hypothetical protein